MTVIISKTHRKLLVPSDATPDVLIGGAPKLDGYAIVDHDIRNTLLLRHLGHTIPNPMLCYYKFFGPNAPFATQRATCQMLTEHRRAYVLNDMGTGKSRAVLWAWDYLNQQGCAKKILIVCKLSNLYDPWAHEAFAILPHRKVQVLYGTRPERLRRLAEDADIYVVNHDGLRTIQEALQARADIDTLVLDELAVYRNQSDRSKGMRKFAARFNILWGLTGRPMPQAPTDVWAQCKIITPSTAPASFRIAQFELMDKIANYVWVPKPNAIEKAYSWMQPAVRFTLDQVMELPPTVYRTIDIPLGTQQKQAYLKVAREAQAMVNDKVITAANAGVAMSKLLKIAGGWVYSSGERDVITLDATNRIEMLFDLIDDAVHKVIVFIPFRHALEGIAKLAEADNMDFCMVHGGTPHREELFNAFQRTSKYRVLFGHPMCMAHGLTLTAADTVIWYMPTSSLEIYEQANARIIRVSQLHKQLILHLQSTPVERRIYTLLSKHQAVQDKFLSMFEEATDDAAVV